MPPSSDHALSEAYSVKDASYYGNARVDYVECMPDNPQAAVLELGCGNGATGALALRRGKAGRYVGIELFEEMAAQADKVLTTTHLGDVERITLPYSPSTFDALILSEVLEHLVDPEATLRRLAALLKPGALVLASSPNISHWKNLVNLAQGHFRYTDSGMMDRTHLRWFTPESFRELFENVGVKVDRLAPLNGLNRWERLVSWTPFAPIVYFQIDLHGHYAPSTTIQ